MGKKIKRILPVIIIAAVIVIVLFLLIKNNKKEYNQSFVASMIDTSTNKYLKDVNVDINGILKTPGIININRNGGFSFDGEISVEGNNAGLGTDFSKYNGVYYMMNEKETDGMYYTYRDIVTFMLVPNRNLDCFIIGFTSVFEDGKYNNYCIVYSKNEDAQTVFNEYKESYSDLFELANDYFIKDIDDTYIGYVVNKETGEITDTIDVTIKAELISLVNLEQDSSSLNKYSDDYDIKGVIYVDDNGMQLESTYYKNSDSAEISNEKENFGKMYGSLKADGAKYICLTDEYADSFILFGVSEQDSVLEAKTGMDYFSNK